jgi:type IV fimbrial biogenesis protein FimT
MTLVEMVVVLAIASVLLGLATPSIREWLRATQARSVAEGLLGGARLAQGEAMRRDRQVVLARTAGPACRVEASASSGGLHWMVRTVPAFEGDPVEIVRCGAFEGADAGILVTGPAVLCFNGTGRVTANPDPGIDGAQCAAQPARFEVRAGAEGRALAVDVARSGGARLCDPARTLSGEAPHGCAPAAP